MSKMVGQDMLTGMGFIGTKPGMYRMTPPYTFGEAEGTAISVESKAGPLKGLRVMGRTEQKRTTGAQLFNAVVGYLDKSNTTVNASIDGYTISVQCTVDTQGSINNKVYRNVTYYINDLAGKKVTASVDSATVIDGEEDYNICDINYKLNGKTSYFLFGAGNSKTIDIPEDAEKIILRIKVVENKAKTIQPGTYTTVIKGLMLCCGSTALPWEPYTGGIPSPNPDYPQEMVRVGSNGSINVSVTDGAEDNVQSLTLATPNGLPGIPVTDASIATYTDADGQMWCCDEVDLERGVYVQRVLCDRVRPEGSWNYSSITKRFYKNDNRYIRAKKNSDYYPFAFCTHFKPCGHGVSFPDLSFGFINNTSYGFAFKHDALNGSVTAWKSFLDENDIYVLGILATPIETPLSAAELAAYRALRTNKPVTTIFNDANANMKVKYRKER